MISSVLISTVRAAGVIDDAPTIAEVGLNVLKFLLSAFGVLALIAFIVSGALFFIGAGNPRALATAKRSATYSLVGVVIALSAYTVLQLVISRLS